MSTQTLITGEGARARVVLDNLARQVGMSSGQQLLCHMESLTAEQSAPIAAAIAGTVPSSAPVDEVGAALGAEAA